VEQHVQDGGFQNRGVLHLFSGGGSASEDENACPNDGSDAKRSKGDPAERFLESFFWVFGIGNQLIDVFAAEEL
jgi:hypothetical protein